MVDDKLKGPDLTLGVAPGELAEGAMLLGHAGGEQVLLAHDGGEFFAIGASCTHYHGPLAEGVLHHRTCAALGIMPVSIFAPVKSDLRPRARSCALLGDRAARRKSFRDAQKATSAKANYGH